jgi:hypothetical protein
MRVSPPLKGGFVCIAVFAVPTFVPAQAVFPCVLPTKIAVDVRKILIDNDHANELRIRNAWVRGSNPLCGTSLVTTSEPVGTAFGTISDACVAASGAAIDT